MTPVRLEPAALRSRVKHSTTEPLRSQLHSVILEGTSEANASHFGIVLALLLYIYVCVCVFHFKSFSLLTTVIHLGQNFVIS